MSERVHQLISSLGLMKHPEGGYFREVFRSPHEVTAERKRGTRSALTTIYFLLADDDHSSWHRIDSDETWHHYEGAPIELFIVDPDSFELRRITLGPPTDGQEPVVVVPAGCWQAARSSGEYTLAGCSVGPGFDFADFLLLRDDEEMSQVFREKLPGVTSFI